jgi:RNA polymerase sigma factor (sigma-70 family)
VRNRAEADDVVAETFAKILDLLHRGGGPDDAFRPYLLTAVRRAAYDRHRAERRQLVTDEMEAFDRGVPFADPTVADLERTMIARAFASLPERWQAVLWHTEIEGATAADVAPLLGLTANSVAALAYRAREGLRQAYLQMHLSRAVRDECRPVAAKLGAYVRGGLAKRDAAVVGPHLDLCAECRRVFAELGDVNVALKGIVAPVVLGPAAVAYLASAAGKRSAGAWIAGRLAWFRRAPKGQQAGAAGVAAAAVVGLAAVALALTGHSGPEPASAHRALPRRPPAPRPQARRRPPAPARPAPATPAPAPQVPPPTLQVLYPALRVLLPAPRPVPRAPRRPGTRRPSPSRGRRRPRLPSGRPRASPPRRPRHPPPRRAARPAGRPRGRHPPRPPWRLPRRPRSIRSAR